MAQSLTNETSVFGDILVILPMSLSLFLTGLVLFHGGTVEEADEHEAARLGICIVGLWALLFCGLSYMFLPFPKNALPIPSTTSSLCSIIWSRFRRMSQVKA